MGRAASILKSCSSKYGKETLHNFISILFGATCVTWRRHIATWTQQGTRNYIGEERCKQKRKFGSERRFFFISSFFTTASRNGHRATAAEITTVDRQSKHAGKQRSNRKWEEKPPSLKSCSKSWNRENAAQYFFSPFWVLHTAPGGVKAPQLQQRYTRKDRIRKTRKKKENAAANGDIFLFYLFSMRHGAATAPQQQRHRRRQSKAQGTQRHGKKQAT